MNRYSQYIVFQSRMKELSHFPLLFQGNVTRNPRILNRGIPGRPILGGRFEHIPRRSRTRRNDGRPVANVVNIIVPPPPGDISETPNTSNEEISCKHNIKCSHDIADCASTSKEWPNVIPSAPKLY